MYVAYVCGTGMSDVMTLQLTDRRCLSSPAPHQFTHQSVTLLLSLSLSLSLYLYHSVFLCLLLCLLIYALN